MLGISSCLMRAMTLKQCILLRAPAEMSGVGRGSCLSLFLPHPLQSLQSFAHAPIG